MGDDGPPPRLSFGETIRRLRRDLELTQRDVARELGIDFTYLSKLENDRGEPPGEETVRKLARVLQTDAEELLALAGKLPPELRTRAQSDVVFARVMRRLSTASDDDIRAIYDDLKIQPPEQ